jgi:riboflavin kinase/FMN adenylyltransferase
LGEIVILQFDAALRQLEAKQFIAALHRLFPRLQTLSMGDNWTFGKDREGNTAQLRRWAEGHGFSCSSITPLEENGRPISSTRIRQAILDRDFSTAALLLGRPYAVAGRVSRGEQRGRTLGFPTANLADVVQLLPPLGVYAGCATIPNGKKFRAVLNLGSRPTFHSNPATSLEIHLLEFQGDLYDQKIEICPLQYLRDEQKFADSAALQQQIRKDISQALQCNFPPC